MTHKPRVNHARLEPGKAAAHNVDVRAPGSNGRRDLTDTPGHRVELATDHSGLVNVKSRQCDIGVGHRDRKHSHRSPSASRHKPPPHGVGLTRIVAACSDHPHGCAGSDVFNPLNYPDNDRRNTPRIYREHPHDPVGRIGDNRTVVKPPVNPDDLVAESLCKTPRDCEGISGTRKTDYHLMVTCVAPNPYCWNEAS